MFNRNKIESSNTCPNKVFIRLKSSEKVVIDDSMKILLRVLYCLGIDAFGSSYQPCLIFKVFKYLYPLYACIVILLVTTMSLHHVSIDSSMFKTNVTYSIICWLSLFLWHVVYRRKKSLQDINKKFGELRKFSKEMLSYNLPKSCFIRSLLIINFCLIFLSSFTIFFESKYLDHNCLIMSYHKLKKCGLVGKLYLFIFSSSVSFVASSFTNLISILYCVMCYRCSVMLIRFRKRMKSIQNSMEYYKLQNKLGREYLELIQLIRKVQSLLSLPSLLILIISFMQAFISLARIMLNSSEELISFIILEHICVHIPTGIFTFVIPAYGSQITREMNKNKMSFHRMSEFIVFKHDDRASLKNLELLETLYKVTPVTFSAYEMVQFSGSTILAALGTLLTYGLLVLNINAK